MQFLSYRLSDWMKFKELSKEFKENISSDYGEINEVCLKLWKLKLTGHLTN